MHLRKFLIGIFFVLLFVFFVNEVRQNELQTESATLTSTSSSDAVLEETFHEVNTDTVDDEADPVEISNIVGDTNVVFYKNDASYTLLHGGLTRKYVVHFPPVFDGKMKLPMVIAIHGGAGNADTSPTFFNLNEKADEEGFIVVYPEGTGVKILGTLLGSWNGGDCCGPALTNGVDDVGFLSKMIDRMIDDFMVDRNRVYATGMSNGAIMSYALACKLPNKIAAIAPVSSIGYTKDCDETRAVPVLHMHGIDDPCATYDGCKECVGCTAKFLQNAGLQFEERTIEAMSVPDYIERQRLINGCDKDSSITYKNGGATCISYEKNCTNGATVVLCSIDDMGHTWPGQDTYGIKVCEKYPNGLICTNYKNTVGSLSEDLDANDMLWNFFKTQSLQ